MFSQKSMEKIIRKKLRGKRAANIKVDSAASRSRQMKIEKCPVGLATWFLVTLVRAVFLE